MALKFNPFTSSLDQVTTPGGATTQVQFNDAGAFNGDSGLTYTKATDTLTIAGSLLVDTNTFVVDAANNRVGIGTVSPAYPLHAYSTSVNEMCKLETTQNYCGIHLVRQSGGGTAQSDWMLVSGESGNSRRFAFEDVTNGLTGSNGPFIIESPSFARAFYAGTAGVGIGIIPAARFHVSQSTLGDETFKIESTATNDDPNYRIYQGRVATTDATVTTLHTIAITSSNTYLIEARVVARRTGGVSGTADDGAVYIRRAMVTTKAGTVTINTVQDGLTQEDQAAWDCTLDVSTTNIRVRVTGAASNNVTWHSTVIIQNLST